MLETITKVEPEENACSKAKTISTVRLKPGASPLLFGEFLMQLCAFVFLEDISGELPPYEESYLSVPMDAPMREAYTELEDAIRNALKAHRGNRSESVVCAICVLQFSPRGSHSDELPNSSRGRSDSQL